MLLVLETGLDGKVGVVTGIVINRYVGRAVTTEGDGSSVVEAVVGSIIVDFCAPQAAASTHSVLALAAVPTVPVPVVCTITRSVTQRSNCSACTDRVTAHGVHPNTKLLLQMCVLYLITLEHTAVTPQQYALRSCAITICFVLVQWSVSSFCRPHKFQS
eukprot:SAG11_NODE_312_length_10890_cov_44.733043_4_plen_159_part_00